MVRTYPTSSLLDRFMPDPAMRHRHQTLVAAPAAFMLDTAWSFDLRAVPLVRAIFRLRAMMLGAKGPGTDWSRGFVEELLRIGWGVLAEEKGRWLVAGAVCQPWLADVIMRPLPPDRFAAYCEPGQVKIVWTLEADPLGEARCRFSTETRAVGTDAEAKAKFRRYYRRFGVGMVLIRWLLLPALRREAERRWRALHPVAGSG
jgi:hypothetical protein